MTTSLRPMLALAVLAMVLAACGGAAATPSGVATLDDPAATAAPNGSSDPGGSAAPSASIDPEAAMLAFARCMREHGIDMPDPVVGPNGGTSVTIGGDGGTRPDAAVMQAANEACKALMPKDFGPGGGELTPEQKDAMLDFAKCMRDHGVDMADPDFSGNGFSIQIDGSGKSGPSPDDPAFKAADEACRSIMEKAMPGFGTPGGGPVTQQGGPATQGVQGAPQ
jgi:hypothetical protein